VRADFPVDRDLPLDLGNAGAAVDDTREDEKEIRQPIDVSYDERVGRRVERDDSALGTTANGSREMEGRSSRRATGQDKPGERRQFGLEPIDQGFEPCHVGVADGRFRHASGDSDRRVGQAGPQREEVALDLQKRFVDVWIGARRAREAQASVDLIDFTIGVDPGVGFADACAVEKRCLAGIARARVDLHRVVPSGLYEMPAKQPASTRKHPSARGTQPAPMPLPRDRQRFRERLLSWYRRHGRDLPWRQTSDPYHILVSEIMLQQTQVERVLPKYAEWLEKYPSLHALASAPEGEVTATWYPLGYNVRPRRLQTIARESVARYGGQLPADEETLLSFKGIGAYTAGAIRSFAFRERAAIVDTNVARVLFRVFVGRGDPKSHAMKRHLWALSETLVPSRHVFDFNQALMDLGAMVCVARNPKCLVCPMTKSCRTFQISPDRE